MEVNISKEALREMKRPVVDLLWPSFKGSNSKQRQHCCFHIVKVEGMLVPLPGFNLPVLSIVGGKREIVTSASFLGLF